jgi:zinc transport system substrate-binding protein
MGTLGEPDLIVSQGASPHGYSLRPSEAQAVQDADIVFWVSAGLTPWLADTIVTLAPEARQLELLEVEGITELDLRESALFESHGHEEENEHDDEHDDEHGDEHDDSGSESDEHASGSGDEHNHGEHDPHAWLDPSNAVIWLETIAAELSKIDPSNADTYSANAKSAKVQLEQLKTELTQVLDPVRNGNFIVFHDAYQYFENAFDFPASGAISISDASKPSPARIQQIHDLVADADVTCVLAEPQFNPDLVDTVLDGTNAQSSSIDPLGSHLQIGPTLYPQLLRELAQTLGDCV